MRKILTAIFVFFFVAAGAQVENVVPNAPIPPRLVKDYTNTLTPSQVQALEAKLVAYDDSTSNQVAIVIVKTLEGYDVADYARALGRKWGVGGREYRNGVVILIAMEERKSRIEVGYGLEGAIPDITAKSIIDNSLTPNFKEGNYYRGFDRATDDIMAAAAGEYKAPSNYGSKKKKGPGAWSIIGGIILLLIFGGLGGGRRGGGGTLSGAGWIIGSMLASSGRSSGGGWSGGGGGGGFGGFGGGSFGGGGASGSW
jgi:uncharacterized protein